MKIKELEAILKKHSEVIGDTRRLISLLKDYFPEEQKNIRLLGNALEIDILQQIRTNQLDKIMYTRLCKQLTEEFSLQPDKASWAVGMWIRAYGSGMLNKPLLYAVEDMDLPDQNNKNLERGDELNENVVIPQSVVITRSEVLSDSKAMEVRSGDHREHSSVRVRNHAKVAFCRKKSRWKRIVLAARKLGKAVVALSVVAVVVAVVFAISTYISKGRIDHVNQMISNLPDTVSDYSLFEQEIGDAYAAYMRLDVKQQSCVVNSEKLFACVDEFNSYQIGLVRRELAEVSADSVQNTNVLEKLEQLSGKLTNEQRAMLTESEDQALEQVSCVYATIKGIEDLTNDVIGKYDMLPEIKKNYSRLTEEYRGLVYNASELETIEEKYQLQTALVFSEGGGGWAVSVKSDAKESLSGDIVIPSEYQGQPVTVIPEGAFSGCAGIRSIIVPDSVTGIGKGAFSGCIGLQSITLPFVGASRSASGEEGLFGYIFGGSSYSGGMQVVQYYHLWEQSYYYIPNQLKEVTITDAVQLGYGAFDNCSMLTAINLNSEIVGAGDKVFRNCSGITTVNIPGILVISESMFEGCSSLTTLTLSESVMRIEENAFMGCLSLVSLNSELVGDFVIGNSVQFIGKSAFGGCIQMQSITLPFVGNSRTASGAEGLLGYIFGDSSYSGGMQVIQYYHLWEQRYYYIPNQLKEVTITDAVQLGYGAFHNCSMLDKLTINSGAKSSVGDRAFEGCVKPAWK